MKRILALVLCLLFLCGSALAAETFAPHWTQLEKEMAQGQGVHLDVAAKLNAWSPFETDTTTAINALLKHFTFGVDYFDQPDETRFGLTVYAGDEPVITMSQLDNAQGTEWSSDLYDAVYTLPKDSDVTALALMAQFQDGEELTWEEMLLGHIDLNAFMDQFSGKLMSEGKAAKSNKNLGKAGRAAKTYKITTDGPGAQKIVAEAASAFNSPSLETMLSQLTFSGKKNIFTLYEKNDGTLIGINFTGNAAYGDGDARKVTLTWSCKETDEQRLDTLNLKAPSVKGKNDLTVKITWQRTFKAGQNTQTIEGNVTSRLNNVTTKEKYTVDLKNAKGTDHHKITGSVKVETTRGDVKQTLVVKPNLKTTGDGLTGSLDIQTQQGGKTLLSAVLNLNMTQLIQSALETPALLEVIPLEEMSEEAIAETQNDLARMVAHRLLMAVMTMPEKDLAALKYGISDSNWQSILEAFQQIAP